MKRIISRHRKCNHITAHIDIENQSDIKPIMREIKKAVYKINRLTPTSYDVTFFNISIGKMS